MRFVAKQVAALRHGFLALGLLALQTGNASAQMVFDGNLLFNNNNTGTLAGQFVGAATASAPACVLPFSAADLGTISYTHNRYADPLLPNAPYQSGIRPNFRPALGSPAYGYSVAVPNDGFFTQTCFAGALSDNEAEDWTQGWTYWDSTGASRQDLHLVGMLSPRPLAIYDGIKIYGHQFWSADSNYLVRGQLRIKSQASLNVAPGVVIFEEDASVGTIIAERGGKLYAIGTACEPIIVTSDATPGTQTAGGGGGIILNGYARTNSVNSCAGDSAASEGGAVGYFGGNDDADNSGTLRYVRVEFAGKEITPNNELNAFTWNSCGRNTHGDYLQAYQGDDDGFEWFGGSMDQKHLIAIDGRDDGYDWQLGTRNRAQFVIVRVSPQKSRSGGQNGDKGIEADNISSGSLQCSGRSNTVVSNFTIIGDKRSGPLFPGVTSGVNFRVGTAGTFINSIVYNMKTAALKIDDQATFQAHCSAPPVGPTLFCSATSVGVNPISTGDLFVANSLPNPFRTATTLSFTLSLSGPVSVEIYSADGRLVDTLAKGELPAGRHSLVWAASKHAPSGIYFYKVVAGARQSTGKLTRID